MKILIDMSLSPDWVSTIQAGGHDAVHWSRVGDARAKDSEIMEYARIHEFVVFTHDLDFGTILALTHADGPSVVQIRAQDVMPKALGKKFLAILAQHQAAIESGALLTLDDASARVRVLPI